MSETPSRVRVMFINCPKLSTEAAGYLILAQNKFQTSMQFEVVHYWIHAYHDRKHGRITDWIWGFMDRFPLVKILPNRIKTKLELNAAPCFVKQFTHEKWYDELVDVVNNYDKWVLKPGFNQFDSHKCPTIIITETGIEGNYIGLSRNNLALISAAQWKRFFKPGSALEFILTSVQRYALRLCYGTIGSHYVTRGCIWDFNVYQPDSRIAAYLGTLCSTCEAALSKSVSKKQLTEIKSLISNGWIGDIEDSASVAAVLSKIYKYDLRRPSAINARLRAVVSKGMQNGIPGFIFDILKYAITALVILFIASRYPDWYEVLSELF